MAKNEKKWVGVFMLVALLFFSSAWADKFSAADKFKEGVTAYNLTDYATALSIFGKLASDGYSTAQFNLGVMNNKGQGVPQDYAEAIKWWRLAAAQGDADAQFSLGIMYAKGKGVVQDYAEAVKWFRLAAAQGDSGGQLKLGVMYERGQGVIQDYVRAYMWANIAATGGDPDAANNRDMIAGKMTPMQIAESQKMARDCLAKNFKGCN